MQVKKKGNSVRLCVGQDAEGLPVEVKMRSKGGVYQCSYTPTSSLKHTVSVSWGGVSVPNSPFRVSSQSRLPVTTASGITLLKREDRVEAQAVKERHLNQRSAGGRKTKKPLIIITTYTEQRFSC